MGGIAHKAIKPFKNWNVMNRAIRQTEKDMAKPRAATKLPLQIDAMSQPIIDEKNMKLIEEISKFDISSTEITEGNRQKTKSHRPLPKKRLAYDIDYTEDKEIEPIIIPEGKITVSLLVEMLKMYRDDISIEELADTYKLPPEKVYNILRYNRLFVLNPPGETLRMLIGDEHIDNDNEDTKAKDPGPTQPRVATMLYPEAYGKYTPSE